MAESRTVRVDTRVLRRRAPVRYLAFLRDGTYVVGARGFTDRGSRGFRQTSMAALLRLDATLGAALGLRRGWAAWRDRTGSAWTRAPLPHGDVHLLEYEVRSSAPTTRGTGAFVSAWVRRRSLAGARRVARAEIDRAGYRIVSVAGERRISLAECAPAGRRFFRQAEIDGVTLVFLEHPTRRRERRRRR